jgi:hypothetical protein
MASNNNEGKCIGGYINGLKLKGLKSEVVNLRTSRKLPLIPNKQP